MASMIMYIVASVTGAPDALAALRNFPTEALKKVTQIIIKKPLRFWINVLKRAATKNYDYAAVVSGLESLVDLIFPFKFQCK